MTDPLSAAVPPTDPLLAKQQADAEKAAAEARTAKAEAEKAEAEADKVKAATAQAQAEAAKAQAEADKAKTEAAKAQQEVDNSLESDPEVVAARKASRVAELAKAKAEADAAGQKAGVPEAPTLGSITEPADKSAKVEDAGGQATARLAAVHALQLVGEGIGDEVVAALIGHRRPAKPVIRPRQQSLVDRFVFRRAGPEPSPVSEPTKRTNGAQHRVWVMESAGAATGDLLRLELTRRLKGYKTIFAVEEPATPPQNAREGVAHRGLEEVAAGAAAAGAVAAGGPPAVAAVAALSIASNVVKFGVELAGALRGRYALLGREIELSRTALLSGVAGRIADSGVTVKWQRYAPVDQSPTMNLFGEAIAAREAFAATTLAEPEPPEDATKKVAFERAKKLVDAFDAFVTEITKPGASGLSPLVESAATELFEPPPETSATDYLLYVDISAKGADAMTGYGLFKGTTAAFLGFSQAYYVLVRRDGTVVTSGSITDDVAARLHLDTANLDLPAEPSSKD